MYSAEGAIAFGLGNSSIFFWILCQTPQFIENWQRQSGQALSICFILEWLAGDITNLLGAEMSNQLATQIHTAIVFVCLDIVLISEVRLVALPSFGEEA